MDLGPILRYAPCTDPPHALNNQRDPAEDNRHSSLRDVHVHVAVWTVAHHQHEPATPTSTSSDHDRPRKETTTPTAQSAAPQSGRRLEVQYQNSPPTHPDSDSGHFWYLFDSDSPGVHVHVVVLGVESWHLTDNRLLHFRPRQSTPLPSRGHKYYTLRADGSEEDPRREPTHRWSQ